MKRYKEDDHALIDFIRYDIDSIHGQMVLNHENSNNPEESFLAIRLLARYIDDILGNDIELALEEIEKLIIVSPELLNGMRLISFLHTGLHTLTTDSFNYRESLRCLFGVCVGRVCKYRSSPNK